ncbi:MAG: hypothetical protein ACRDD1_17530 [Planctomycetia bacterium]
MCAAFDLDAQTERFRIVVLPGEIEAAKFTGDAYLYGRIEASFLDCESDGGFKADSIRVYHGLPG